jgi:Flp pilus assembly protein TadD
MSNALETVYESEDIEIRYFQGESRTCFVTFTSLGLNQDGFAQRILISRKVSSVFFISKWNHWYQPNSVRVGAERIRTLLAERSFDKIVTYGASMGGFGAAAYAGLLGAHHILALAPQFNIRPQDPPYERRWEPEATKIDFAFNDLPRQMGQATKTIVFDPLSSDLKHARLFAETPDCNLVSVPFCGHTPGRVLAHCGLLQTLPLLVAENKFNLHQFYKTLHLGRRKHYDYWSSLADYAQKHSTGRLGQRRKRLEIALYAAEQGLLRFPDQSQLALKSAYLLLHLGRVAEAVAAARNAVSLAPDHPAPWRALGAALRHSGEFAESLEAARRAVSLRPKDLDLRRLLIQALHSMKLYEECIAECRSILELDPLFAEGHAVIGASLRMLGRDGEAAAEFERALEIRPGAPAWVNHLSELRSAGLRREAHAPVGRTEGQR